MYFIYFSAFSTAAAAVNMFLLAFMHVMYVYSMTLNHRSIF